mmetsp:Transcript_4564/g.11007  ORF Transcript_4564/g.11007 Transcript_4564/m.11007 type:complete len:271 (-) Transcript_4564:289-1101(-)
MFLFEFLFILSKRISSSTRHDRTYLVVIVLSHRVVQGNWCTTSRKRWRFLRGLIAANPLKNHTGHYCSLFVPLQKLLLYNGISFPLRFGFWRERYIVSLRCQASFFGQIQIVVAVGGRRKNFLVGQPNARSFDGVEVVRFQQFLKISLLTGCQIRGFSQRILEAVRAFGTDYAAVAIGTLGSNRESAILSNKTPRSEFFGRKVALHLDRIGRKYSRRSVIRVACLQVNGSRRKARQERCLPDSLQESTTSSLNIVLWNMGRRISCIVGWK